MSREKQIDYKKWVRHMRENCVKDHNGNIVCSGELWEELANIIENLANQREQSENVIKLPIKVGDTVYVPWRWAFQQGVANVKVEEIKFYDSQMHYMFLIDMESDNECFNQSFGGWKIEQCIGKTVFLTREGAEMKGGAK